MNLFWSRLFSKMSGKNVISEKMCQEELARLLINVNYVKGRKLGAVRDV